MKPLHDQRIENRKAMADAMQAATIDPAKIEALRAERMKIADESSKRFTKALTDAGNVLSAQQRQAFFSLVETAASIDLLVAYLPQASLGTAIEMWEAYHHGRVVVAITPLRENWVVNLLARAVLPSIEAFEAFAADGRLTALVAEPAAARAGLLVGEQSA